MVIKWLLSLCYMMLAIVFWGIISIANAETTKPTAFIRKLCSAAKSKDEVFLKAHIEMPLEVSLDHYPEKLETIKEITKWMACKKIKSQLDEAGKNEDEVQKTDAIGFIVENISYLFYVQRQGDKLILTSIKHNQFRSIP